MLENISLQMFENGYADIHLIIRTKDNTSSNIVAYFYPIWDGAKPDMWKAENTSGTSAFSSISM